MNKTSNKNMNISKVSIIVPIYNVELYLRRCLDSLVNQTLKDIEIICINDCSPDNSLVILKEYAESDNRIKIIDFEKNQGVNAARNGGMKIAKGEYIGFCDPDDYVDLDFYEKLYKLAKNKDADIVHGNAKYLNYGMKEEGIRYNYQIQKRKYFFYIHFWTGIYRRSMLKKHLIKFPVDNVITGGDIVFLDHAVIIAKRVVFLNNSYYHYVRRDDSLASSIYSHEKCRSVLYCLTLIINRLNISKISKSHYSYIYNKRFLHAVDLLGISDVSMIKEITKCAIKFYNKCKFPESLNLSKNFPKPIIAALKKKNENEVSSILLEWKSNECYPKINIKESALQNRKLYVWGTGADCSKVQMQCERNNWKISTFLDSNKDIKEFNGYKVKRPEQILNRAKRDFFIIISSRAYGKEIAKVCERYGLKKGVDFWRP